MHYRPGKEANRPDALSRLEQDAPKDPDDPRLRHREQQLLDPAWITSTEHTETLKSGNETTEAQSPFDDEKLNLLWKKCIKADGEYRDIKNAFFLKDRCFPPSVTAKMLIAECLIDKNGFVKWRDRLLVPIYEPLQTALIHKAHDSPLTGHPGRESTLSILSRDFHWPKMSNMIRQFVRNCDVCERTPI